MTMVCFVLFADDAEIPEERWQNTIGDDLPFRVRISDISCTDSGVVEFKFDSAPSSQKNPGSIMLARMPTMEADENAPPTALWQSFHADMASHQSHWVLTTFGSDFTLVEEALLLTHFTHSLLQAFPTSLGVFWNKHGLRVSSEAFQSIVSSLEPDQLPTSVWIDILVAPASEPDGQQIAMTTGMDAFEMMEIECIGSPEPPEETHARIDGVCEYLLNNGPVLKHGHTIGQSESERINIIHGASAFGREGRVMHLVYGEVPTQSRTSVLGLVMAFVGLPLAALAMIAGIVFVVGTLTRPGDAEPAAVASAAVEPEEKLASKNVAVTPNPASTLDNTSTVARTPLMTSPPDWSNVKEIDLTVEDFWKPTEQLQDFESFSAKPIRVPLDDLGGVRVANPIVNPFARRALLVATGSTGSSRVNSRLAVGDLESGRILHLATVRNASAKPMAYSESRQMAWISTGQRSEELQGWRLRDDQVEQSEPWDPFSNIPDPQLPQRQSRSAAIRFVYPMAESTLVVGNEDGHVVIWNIASMTPLAHYHVGYRPAWAITPNGQFLALATSSELTIVDIRSKELIAKRSLSDIGSISWPKLDFSPDTSELFLSSVSRIVTLSSEDGSITDNFTVGGLSTSNGAIFVDQDHVLVNGSHLISRSIQQTVQRLSGLGVPINFDRYTYAIVNDASEMVLWPLVLPTKLIESDARVPAVLTVNGLQ